MKKRKITIFQTLIHSKTKKIQLPGFADVVFVSSFVEQVFTCDIASYENVDSLFKGFMFVMKVKYPVSYFLIAATCQKRKEKCSACADTYKFGLCNIKIQLSPFF